MFSPLPVEIEFTCLPLIVAAYALYLSGQKAASDNVQNREFLNFQRKYFLPYFMALFSDWLQGPYVYKLYSHYGFPQREIAVLYVVGFAASVTFGTCTGPLADKFGRKKMSVVFCLVYAFCCITKLSPSFNILLLGRVLGGISTSILFSVFESWYVHEHQVTWKYPLDWTSLTFSKATFFNGLLAIIAGIVAQAGSEWAGYGPVAPFMIAVPFLLAAAYLISTTWDENYGERSMNWSGSCVEGFSTIMRNYNILSLGLVQSLFESNMYIFVFLWTPVLDSGHPPLGLTFASFMIAIMIGSSLYSLMLNKGYHPEEVLKYCCLLMGASFLVCATSGKGFSLITDDLYVNYIAFIALEVSIGMYFPCIGRLRGETIPDHLRANIMNWFRVPMNVITCGGLVGMHHFDNPNSSQIMFLLCASSSIIGYFFARSFANTPKPKTGEEDISKSVVDADANADV